MGNGTSAGSLFAALCGISSHLVYGSVTEHTTCKCGPLAHVMVVLNSSHGAVPDPGDGECPPPPDLTHELGCAALAPDPALLRAKHSPGPVFIFGSMFGSYFQRALLSF